MGFSASGSVQPPSKSDDKVQRKPRESEALLPKTSALSSTGWQSIDTRRCWCWLFEAQTDKTSLLHCRQLWIRNWSDRNRGEIATRMKSISTKGTLGVLIGKQTELLLQDGYTDVLKQEQVFSDWDVDKSPDKVTKWLKTFICSSTIRAWRPGSGQRMTREEAKTSSQLSRKDYRSEGSIEVWKALLEEE
ncbi:hypothetical protein Tco_0823285 [Tanacetum coccineum]|uniref:Uncharacterized protein n=1 Tax=Tanacetum coccineum TaxID=301880 RepID=A0ABQ5ALJ2_9ASTR